MIQHHLSGRFVAVMTLVAALGGVSEDAHSQAAESGSLRAGGDGRAPGARLRPHRVAQRATPATGARATPQAVAAPAGPSATVLVPLAPAASATPAPASSAAPAPTPRAASGAAHASNAAGTYTSPTTHRMGSVAPTPTPEQVKALEQMRVEASDYEKAARDYRDTITRIVQYHYDEKRRRLLASLDSEIDVEKKSLREAREDAIKRLEEFVARYSGPTANPENTPDAMFRLAALYEERARGEGTEDVTEGLRPAIALYKRIIREFPDYRELAGIYYYLGHALNDSSRLEEAQQVWRSLVCHNRYPYPVPADPKNPDVDTIGRLPQDHTADYWLGWNDAHPTPPGLGGPAPRARARTRGGATEENSFSNPYPDSCAGVAQAVEAGAEPRYVAEIWWQIGNWHFDQIDPTGGPYNLNRAAVAYQQGMKYKKPPLYGVTMYKLAWTYFKQQRYETAVREFVSLLGYTDEQEKATGDPGADFRAEAYTYIAGSLTYLDFVGPCRRSRSSLATTCSTPRPILRWPSRRCAWRSSACKTRSSSRKTRSGRRRSTRRSSQEFREVTSGTMPSR